MSGAGAGYDDELATEKEAKDSSTEHPDGFGPGLLLGALAGILLGIFIGNMMTMSSVKTGAVELNIGRYHPKGGQFQLLNPEKKQWHNLSGAGSVATISSEEEDYE